MVVVVAAVSLFAGVANAEEQPTTWYGWQILASDLAGFGLIAVAGDSNRGGVGPVGAAAFFLGSPAIHFAHGERKRAPISVGMRAGLSLAGALLGGLAASGCDGMYCELDGVGAGLLVGMTAASLCDVSFLARKSIRREQPHVAVRLRAANAEIAFGVAGSF